MLNNSNKYIFHVISINSIQNSHKYQIQYQDSMSEVAEATDIELLTRMTNDYVVFEEPPKTSILYVQLLWHLLTLNLHFSIVHFF